jgi:hypothetical protein
MPALLVVLRSIGFVFCFLAAPCFVAVNFSRADLLVDPTDGNLLWSGSFGSDGQLIEDPVFTINANGAFRGKFFGEESGPVTVSENGQLNFTGAGNFFPGPLVEMPRMIAPLFDDFLFLPGADNAVIDHLVAGRYLAVIKGVQFQADEIVFSLRRSSSGNQ